MKGDHIIAQLRTLLNPSRAAAIVPGIGQAATNESRTDSPAGRFRHDGESVRLVFKQFETPFLVPDGKIDAMLDMEGYGITLLPRDGDDALLITTRRVRPGGSIEQPMLARRIL
jgi:hypothetical protein